MGDERLLKVLIHLSVNLSRALVSCFRTERLFIKSERILRLLAASRRAGRVWKRRNGIFAPH